MKTAPATAPSHPAVPPQPRAPRRKAAAEDPPEVLREMIGILIEQGDA